MMHVFRSFAIGVRHLFHPEQRAHDMDDELSAYEEACADAAIGSGATSQQAHRAARMNVGSTDAIKEQLGTIGWERFIETLLRDLGFAWRVMRKHRLTTLTTLLTLALGIGGNAAMFGIIYGVLLRPLPFPDEHTIAIVHMHFSPQNNSRGNMSLADFADWQANHYSFEHVAAYSASRFILTGGDKAEQVIGASVTADYFTVLEIAPLLGQTFHAGDDSPSAPPKAIISASLWQRRFHDDPNVIGRVIDIDGEPATVIGVVKSAFGFPRAETELWRNQNVKVTRRGPFSLHGIGRLRPGVPYSQAQAELNALATNIERASPSVYSHLSMPVEPVHEYLVHSLRPALLMIFCAAAMLLAITVVNVANLLLARGSSRMRELATRVTLGASRRTLIRQLLTEALLTSALGGVCSLALAYAVVRAFAVLNPANSQIAYQVSFDWHVLVFTCAISACAGVAFGILPALTISKVDVQSGLREGGPRATSGAAHHRLRIALVIAETALSLLLLMSAGLLLRSFLQLHRADMGATAPPDQVLSIGITPGVARSAPDREQRLQAFYRRALADLSTVPGVQYVATSDSMPPNFVAEDDTFRIAGRPWTDQDFPSTSLPRVSPNYFRALGVPLVRGRFFSDSDIATSAPVTIISESLAHRYFPNTDPIGQKLGASGPTNDAPFMTIVGVVGDLKYWGLESDAKLAYYLPLEQSTPPTGFVIVRAPNAAELTPVLEKRLRALDKDIVIRKIMTLQDLMEESVAQPRLRTVLLLSFAAVGLLLACVGTYGVIAYSVSQRTHEIGIRMALGATRWEVLRMVVSNGVMMCIAGAAIGLIAALLAGRALSPFLFGTSSTDPTTIAATCSLLLLVGTIASLLPAIRATRIEPLTALRHE